MPDGLEHNPCKHGELNPQFCSICRDSEPQERKSVYFTAGGQHFHLKTDCSALLEGQQLVRDRGGNPAPLQSGYLDVVKHSRKPCKTCTR